MELHYLSSSSAIKQLVEIYNATNPDKPFPIKKLDENNIKDAFAQIEEFKLTYDGPRVINIEACQ